MVRLPIFPSPSTSRPALTNLRNSAETRLTSCKMNIQSWMARCRMPPEGRCRQHPPLAHCAFVCGVCRPRKPDAVALWTCSDWQCLFTIVFVFASGATAAVIRCFFSPPPSSCRTLFSLPDLQTEQLGLGCLSAHDLALHCVAVSSFTCRPSRGSPATPPKM